MAELPHGSVAFLFADTEGSTARWERDAATMSLAVNRHLDLLRDAIERHDGVRFTTVGDAVQAAFPTAPQSVAAALAAQRVLRNEAWHFSVQNGPRVCSALSTRYDRTTGSTASRLRCTWTGSRSEQQPHWEARRSTWSGEWTHDVS